MINIKIDENNENKTAISATLFGSKRTFDQEAFHSDWDKAINYVSFVSRAIVKRNAMVLLTGAAITENDVDDAISNSASIKMLSIADGISRCETLPEIRDYWEAESPIVKECCAKNDFLKEHFEILDAFILKIKG